MRSLSSQEFEQNLLKGDQPPNEAQLAAIMAANTPVLCNAGPGTGKTDAVTKRILKWIQVDQIEPNSILAVSRTVKAAGEINDRLPINIANTIHHTCRRIINEYATHNEELLEYCAISNRSRPLYFNQNDEEGSMPILKWKLNKTKKAEEDSFTKGQKLNQEVCMALAIQMAIVSLNKGIRIEIQELCDSESTMVRFQKLFGNLWYKIISNNPDSENDDEENFKFDENNALVKWLQQFISNRELQKYIKDHFPEATIYPQALTKEQYSKLSKIKKLVTLKADSVFIDAVTGYYHNILAHFGILDFTRQICITNDLLETEDILELAENRYKAIIVDEFQDVDPVQLNIFLRLSRKNKNLFCVGDRNQEIFQFTGADSNYTYGTFSTAFDHEVKRYFLNINYRSTQNIIDASYTVLKDQPIELAKAVNENNVGTACYNIEKFREIEWNNIRKEDVLVVSRMHRTLNEAANELRDNGIPYTKPNPFQTRTNSIRRPFCINNTIINRVMPIYEWLKDSGSIDKFWNVVDLCKFCNTRTNEGKKFKATMEELGLEVEQIKLYVAQMKESRIGKKINLLFEEFSKWQTEFQESDFLGLINSILDTSSNQDLFISAGNYEWYWQRLSMDTEANRKKNWVSSQNRRFFSVILKNYYRENGTIDINKIREQSVKLETIHAAKGTESPIVIAYCDVFPQQGVTTKLEQYYEKEATHLLYVAFSRAQNQLYIKCKGSEGYPTTLAKVFKVIAEQRKNKPNQQNPIQNSIELVNEHTTTIENDNELEIIHENEEYDPFKGIELEQIVIDQIKFDFLEKVSGLDLRFSFMKMDTNMGWEPNTAYKNYIECYNEGLIVGIAGKWLSITDYYDLELV